MQFLVRQGGSERNSIIVTIIVFYSDLILPSLYNKHKFVQKVAKVDLYCMGLSMLVLSCFGQCYGLFWPCLCLSGFGLACTGSSGLVSACFGLFCGLFCAFLGLTDLSGMSGLLWAYLGLSGCDLA